MLGIVVLFALVVYLFIKHHQNEDPSADICLGILPSGMKLSSDKYLVMLDKSQLESFCTDDIVWLEMYALLKKKSTTDKQQKANWDEFLRKLDAVMHRT